MIKVINLYPTVTWMTFGYKITDILVGYIFVSTLSSIEMTMQVVPVTATLGSIQTELKLLKSAFDVL